MEKCVPVFQKIRAGEIDFKGNASAKGTNAKEVGSLFFTFCFRSYPKSCSATALLYQPLTSRCNYIFVRHCTLVSVLLACKESK